MLPDSERSWLMSDAAAVLPVALVDLQYELLSPGTCSQHTVEIMHNVSLIISASSRRYARSQTASSASGVHTAHASCTARQLH
jgi:hypothetical protein